MKACRFHLGFSLGPGITLCSSTGCQDDIEHSVPGNIHFGFVAKEAGYQSVVVHIGAGYAEITDPIYSLPENEYSLEGKTGLVIGPSGVSISFGDDPEDHLAVQFGVQLYNRYGRGRGLTYAQFKHELGGALDSFAHHTPDRQPVPRETAVDWPYWVGYFKPSSQ